MIISDLPHFENIPKSGSIAGGAQINIEALAIALGDNAFAEGTTSIQVKTIANGRVAIAKGKGSALAVGDSAFANVSYSAAGFDKIKVKERSIMGKKFAFESIRIVALDLPNK